MSSISSSICSCCSSDSTSFLPTDLALPEASESTQPVDLALDRLPAGTQARPAGPEVPQQLGCVCHGLRYESLDGPVLLAQLDQSIGDNLLHRCGWHVVAIEQASLPRPCLFVQR